MISKPSTFSIVALDPHNGDLGVAVESKFIAVGALVPWAKARVGAIATQAWGNVSYGPNELRMLEEDSPRRPVSGSFDDATRKALRDLIHTNNFENKMSEDGRIWKSILDYIGGLAQRI